MEREIGSVAAASAMRGFRYMAFPPVVFEPLSQPTTLPSKSDEILSPGTQAAPTNVLLNVTGRDVGIGWVTKAADPIPAPSHRPAGARGLAVALPRAAQPSRFALLHEVSAELHRQRRP